MKNMLEGRWTTPWSINTIVEDTRCFMKVCSTRVQHIYREGNTLADYLENLAMEETCKLEFRSFSDLPKQGKILLNLDKVQSPNIRFCFKTIATS